MYWLHDKLNLDSICDGRYFIEWVAASIGATSIKTSKRGPNKSPDFVALDNDGAWHVIECKGTQSGQTYREAQLDKPGPPPSGAVVQKRTITFPSSNGGQRLACGLTIGRQGGQEPSSLKIIDPVEDSPFEMTREQMSFGQDALLRSTIARSLRLSGFVATSSVISAPFGLKPSSRPGKGRHEEKREEVVRQKASLASNELSRSSLQSSFSVGDELYRGRRVSFDLPSTLSVGDHPIRSIEVRQGTNARILDTLASTSDGEPYHLANLDVTAVGVKLQAEGLQAKLQIGQAFTSEIELKT